MNQLRASTNILPKWLKRLFSWVVEREGVRRDPEAAYDTAVPSAGIHYIGTGSKVTRKKDNEYSTFEHTE